MSWFSALRTRVRLALGRDAAESRMDQEFRFHLEMETEKNLRAGMSPDDAQRQAALAFGSRQEHREQMRDERGLSWASGLSLDLKLGLRMLAKAPGLAIIGGLGMALATAIAAGAFAIFNSYFWPDLPLDEGDRVVAVVNWDLRLRDTDKRSGYHFLSWRRELKTVDDLGAFRTAGRNLISPSGESEPIVAAEMTASGFRVARVGPLMGRTLQDADELPGAAPVIVIGHDIWQSRFQSDPDILGKPLMLGNTQHTVIGVMPPGYTFPMSHSYWVPLRLDPAPIEPGQGPELDVFGRLAPGVTREQALAELAVLGRRLDVGTLAGPAMIEPRITPYTDIFAEADGAGWEVVMMQVTISLLLVLVCLNVAALVYARTVTRFREIAVRTALGASRKRIVTQLFLEAFVLSVSAAAVGLAIVAAGLSYFDRMIGLISETGRAPFWIDPGLSVSTILYTLGLAVLGAVLIGVLPALRATGKQLYAAVAGGGSGSNGQLGATWTFLIVTQVAVAVAVLPLALTKGKQLLDGAVNDPGFPSEQYLGSRLTPQADARPIDERPTAARIDSLAAVRNQLLSRLTDQADVRGATLAGAIPGNEPIVQIEIDEPGPGIDVRVGSVGQEYFELFSVEVTSGRGFAASDAAALPGERPVVVNRSFEVELLGGVSAVGRRIRHRSTGDSTASWLTVVGVVEDFPAHIGRFGETKAGIYQLTPPGELPSGMLMIRFGSRAPASFVPMLRQVAASVDPTLQLVRIRPMDVTYAEMGRLLGLLAVAVAAITASVLLLSAGGIHALISFTINQRRREIGLRSALGASSRRILTGVLGRSLRQLTLGVAIGLVLALILDRLSAGEAMGPNRLILLPVIALIMIAVGLAAAAGPARRGLRVQPTEALKSD
ncbi:MAG: ABC transporter permease [Gemmatimonadales bacterium]